MEEGKIDGSPLIKKLIKGKKLRARLLKFSEDKRVYSILSEMDKKDKKSHDEFTSRLERLLIHELEFHDQDWVKKKKEEFETLSQEEQEKILKDAYRR